MTCLTPKDRSEKLYRNVT